MSDLHLGSPWAPYGLRDDPFFQQPLEPTTADEAPRPITLFVGRDAELTLVANQVLGSSNSRAIVEGTAGVGKTSFVSRLKAELGRHQVLMHADPVRVLPGMTSRQFVAEVLKVLLQIRATVAAAEPGTPMRKVGQRVKRGATGDADGAFWRRIGRLIQGEDTIGGGLSVAGVGAQRELSRIPAEVGDLSLFDELTQAVAHLTQHGTRKVLIHVNNLENLTLDATRDAASLVQQVRDAFFTDWSHWLFVGTTGIHEEVFRASEQVSGTIPFAITLDPLSAGEVEELLGRRYRHLRMGIRLTPPVSPTDGATLYRRYRGQLRAFLSLLSNAVQRHAAYAPGVPLSVADVVATMAPTFHVEKLVKRIGAADAESLAAVLSGAAFDTEFRVADVVTARRITQAAASKFVQRLLAAEVIRQVRTQGKSVYYQVAHGDLTVALNLA